MPAAMGTYPSRFVNALSQNYDEDAIENYYLKIGNKIKTVGKTPVVTESDSAERKIIHSLKLS
jgi:hypothetical protein